jgi:hypothetical protein
VIKTHINKLAIFLNTRHIYPSFLHLERIEKGGKNERVIGMGLKEMQLMGELTRLIMKKRTWSRI